MTPREENLIVLPNRSIKKGELNRISGLLAFEDEANKSGYKLVAGVDEAGRGPLAGPVVAAACMMPRIILMSGINDSKQVPPKLRSTLFESLTSHPEILYGVGIVSPQEIDRINILEATKVAMSQAIAALKIRPEFLLIDGLALPSHPIANLKVIGGDARSYLIAAASIIAKVTRDRLMNEFDEIWPHYGFKEHKGYGTEKHRNAIEKYGPCSIHRMSFEPLKSILASQN